MEKLTYATRLKIPIEGDNETNFYTKSGLKLATGYIRVVIGGRGPYIEFSEQQVDTKHFHVPIKEQYRLWSDAVYYKEYRTLDSCNVKIYHQKKEVDYADYKIGMYYISPFDLKTDKIEVIIEKLR